MKRINLLPQQWIDQQEQRHAHRLSIVIGGVAIILLLLVSGIWLVRDLGLRSRIGARQEKIAALVEKTSHISDLSKEKTELMAELDDQARLTLPLNTTQTLALLVACMPDEMGLTHLVVESPMPTLVEPTSAGSRQAANAKADKKPALAAAPPVLLQVQGYAASDIDVAKYVEQLGRQPLFRDVKLSMSKEVRVDDAPLHQFFLTMTAPMDRAFVTEGKP